MILRSHISGYYNSEADFDQITENDPSQGTNKENFVAKLDSNGNVYGPYLEKSSLWLLR